MMSLDKENVRSLIGRIDKWPELIFGGTCGTGNSVIFFLWCIFFSHKQRHHGLWRHLHCHDTSLIMLRLQQWQILGPKSTVTGKEVQVWFLWSRFNQFFPSSCYTLLFVVMMMKARHNCDWAFALCSCKVILPPSFSPWDWYLGTASRTVTLCRWWWWLE